VLCLWSDQSQLMALFMVLICGSDQVLFLSPVVNFQFSNSYFPVTILQLNLFSGIYRNKLLFLWRPVIDTLNPQRSSRLRDSLLENGNGASFCASSRNYIIIIIIFIYCNWVVTRWQWLFYIYTKHEIGYC